MIFHNSLKQVFRTPLRTGLFIILIAAITAILSVGINLHLSAVQSIEMADEAFTTIGAISFKNLDNTDLTLNDIMNYDYSPIVNSEHVRLLDRRIMLAGVAEGVTAVYDSISMAPPKAGVMYSVIEFTPEFPADGKRILVRVLKVHHSYHGGFREGSLLWLEQSGNDGQVIQLEIGKKYVTCGYEGYGGSCTVFPSSSEAMLKEAGVLKEDSSFASIAEITTEDYWDREEGQMWGRLVEILQNSVKTLSVYTSNDLETMLIFHQGNALISSGRSFSQADYQEGVKVCILNANTAKRNGFRVGDKIALCFSEEDITFFRQGAVMDSCLVDVTDWGNYEIIGLYTIIDNMGIHGLHEDTIFVPQRSVPIQPDNIPIIRGSSTVTAVSDGTNSVISEVHMPEWENFVSTRLTNGSVAAFKKEMEQYDLSGLRFTFYDQGYSKVSGALGGMRETASLLTAICSAAGLGIALLSSLLFVGRQHRNIAIMYSLGAGRKKALAYLMLCVLVVAGPAAVLGGIAGYTLSATVLEEAYIRNVDVMAVNASYSGASGDNTVDGFQVTAPPGHQAPLTAAGSVLAVTLILSSIFAARVLKAEPMQVLKAKEG
ncbi:MAG: FtsX-like permease family protein [Bacillota bacterium]|jgi:putative ABC transport system permease protein